MSDRVLAINPGSTSTKISVYEDENKLFETTLRHGTEEIAKYGGIIEQYDFRKDVILNALKENNVDVKSLSAVVGRGGLIYPLEGGTYEVDETLKADLRACVMGEHASNLGGLIADEIAKSIGVKAYIVDPVVVDEMEEIAKISGIPQIQRKSIFHALNQKAVGRMYAEQRTDGKEYADLNLIVAHMGGGVSVGAHRKGRIVDVNNALDGDGPFSPERSGGLPIGDLMNLCFSGEYTKAEVKSLIKGKGGLNAYLGTNDGRTVEEMIRNGDRNAELVFQAMAYQIAKEIGACAAVLEGKIDAIILTGGLAYGKDFVSWITRRVEFAAPVVVIPGEDEMNALTQGALRVLRGKEKAKKYRGKNAESR